MIPSALISIALCTYNGEKYIEAQLQSILDQTHQNLEIIIVDDCSTDNTFNIVTKYSAQDQRIKHFQNTKNLGFNKNFEKAILLTSGNFIAISDQDDIWQPFKLELLLKHIDDNWLIFSNSTYIDENGKSSDQNLLFNFSLNNKNYKSILLNNWLTGHTTLFKKEFINNILPFSADGFYDWWMGFVALYHHKITYLDNVLTFYRTHTNSVIQKEIQKTQKKYKSYQRNSTIQMLSAFIKYRYITDIDKIFIVNLLNAFCFKKKYAVSIPLFKIIYKNYPEFYPDRKRRTGLSKFNFVRKIISNM